MSYDDNVQRLIVSQVAVKAAVDLAQTPHPLGQDIPGTARTLYDLCFDIAGGTVQIPVAAAKCGIMDATSKQTAVDVWEALELPNGDGETVDQQTYEAALWFAHRAEAEKSWTDAVIDRLVAETGPDPLGSGAAAAAEDDPGGAPPPVPPGSPTGDEFDECPEGSE